MKRWMATNPRWRDVIARDVALCALVLLLTSATPLQHTAVGARLSLAQRRIAGARFDAVQHAAVVAPVFPMPDAGGQPRTPWGVPSAHVAWAVVAPQRHNPLRPLDTSGSAPMHRPASSPVAHAPGGPVTVATRGHHPATRAGDHGLSSASSAHGSPAGARDAGLASAPTDHDLSMASTDDGTWTPTGSMSVGRAYDTATLLPDGQVLVTGGDDGVSGNTAELYDPASGTWQTTGSMNDLRYDHSATLLPTGKVLIAGGCCGYSGLGVAGADLYDPTSGTFTPTGNMSTIRSTHTATLLPDGRVLVTGGWDQNTYLASAELYDPATGTWSPTGSMHAARGGHTATLLPDGKVLIAGGSCCPSAELYDPVTGTFTPTGAMLTPRYGQTATLLPDGQVLIAGGADATLPALTSAELYNPQTGTFTSTGSMAIARSTHTATLLPDGQVLVAGGCGGIAGACPDAEVYDPGTGTWTPTASMSAARGNHTATLLPDGQVLVAGGFDGVCTPYESIEFCNTNSSAELYTAGAAPLSLLLVPSSAGQGTTITAIGRGFGAHDTVRVILDCAASPCAGGTPLGTGMADASGNVSVVVTVPATATLGTHTIAALGASGAFATAPLTVTPAPTVTPTPPATDTPSPTPSPTPTATPIFPPVPATLYVAPTGSDSNTCLSPRVPCQTISGALSRAAPGATIAVAAGTYGEHVVLHQDTTLIGAGAGQTVIQPPGPGTAVQISAGAVTITGVTIQNARNYPPAPPGGGISNSGTLTLTNSIISGNYDDDSGGGIGNAGTLSISNTTISNNSTRYEGGGIYNTGSLSVLSSTISGNQAVSDIGGGITNDGVMTVTLSTISGNVAGHVGGGIGALCPCSSTLLIQSTVANNTGNDGSDGGITNDGDMTATASTISGNNGGGIGHYSQTLWLINSTLSGNYGGDGGLFVTSGAAILTDTTISGNSGVFYGGGVSNYGGSLRLAASIVAGNTTSYAGPPSYLGPPDCYGTLTSEGANLLGNPSGCSGLTNGQSGDQVGTAAQPLDPGLGPLQDNGGPTLTMAPLPGSPASDAVPAPACTLHNDQRGQPRPDEASDQGACDRGAVENAAGGMTLMLSRTSGRYKDPVAITATAFAPNEAVNIYFDTTTSSPLTSAVSDAAGAISATLSVPQAISGTHTIIAAGQSSGWRADAPFTILPAALLLHYQGYKGTTDVLRGAGFAPYERVTGYWASTSGAALSITATTNGIGTFGGSTDYPGITFTVPLSPSGTYAVYAVGQASGGVAHATFTLKPYLNLKPSSGPPGSQITVVGTGYGAAESVPLKYNCGQPACTSTTVLVTPATDANGSFSVVVTIPASTHAGQHSIGGTGSVSGVFATATFSVP